MKISLRRYLGAQIACITSWPVLLIAQSSDLKHDIGRRIPYEPWALPSRDPFSIGV
jgi:hypothetical protein